MINAIGICKEESFLVGVRKSDRKESKEKVITSSVPYKGVKDKFGKENMSVEEMAAFLRKEKGLTEHDITSKTIVNYIKAICEKSDGLLTTNHFKHDFSKDHSKYEIKPEYQGLLMVLMDSDYFEGRKNDRKLKTRALLNTQLAENVKKYLSGQDYNLLTKNPSYINAQLEEWLSHHINWQLQALMRVMYHAAPVLRYMFMVEFLSSIVHLREWMDREDAKEFSTRLVFAHELDDIHDALYQKGLFSSNTLDKLIINLLALRIHDKDYTYVSEDEELSPVGLYLASKMFNISIKGGSDFKKNIDELDTAIENLDRYKGIEAKAKKILDLKKPDEYMLYQDLMSLSKRRYCAPEVSPEEYDRIVRFTENAISMDKWEILNEFLQLGCQAMTSEKIDKIMKVKDGKHKNPEK